MTGPPRTHTDPPEEGLAFFLRIIAGALAIPAGFIGVYLFLIAGAVGQDASRDEADADNVLQTLLGMSAGVMLLSAGLVGLAFAFKGTAGRALFVVVLVTVALLGAWWIGFDHWCSDCGVP